MDYFTVRNWKEFQHYSHRDPPWIKLHFRLLSGETWVALDDASRVLAIACMLVASRNHGQVPNNPTYIKRVAYLNKTPNFKPLIECGFLEPASTMLADASAVLTNDVSETEKSRDRVETEESREEHLSASPTELVFDHWKEVHRHPKAILDPKRRRLIRAALESYSEADLCLAISGYLNSPHHMGQNDRGTVYTGIELLLRDSAHIDAGLRFHAEPPRTDLSKLTRRNVAAVEDWIPPEERRAAQ